MKMRDKYPRLFTMMSVGLLLMVIGLFFMLMSCVGLFNEMATGMAFYWVISNLSAILVQAVCNIVIKPRKYIDYEDLEESRKELEVLNALGAKRGFIEEASAISTRKSGICMKRRCLKGFLISAETARAERKT